jgi:hypothetical protein
VLRVPRGCELFSHSNCGDSLFLSWDNKADYGAATLDKMQTFATRLKDYQLIWAIVPDKTTAYLNPDKKFWDKAEQRLPHFPNLLRVYRQALQDKTVDLYYGNNTHNSPTGYLLMGAEIYRSMMQQ